MDLLRRLHKLAEIPTSLQEEIFARVFTIKDAATISLDEIRAYENSLKDYRDYTNVINSASKKGKEEGIQQGREAKNLEIARNMLLKGSDILFIQEITGLSKEAIEKLI
jgi:predicted transposase/invertase (TIGR01784 family)